MNCKKTFMKNIMKRFSDRSFQKAENFNIAKLFIPISVSLLFYDEITSGELFSSEDKDPRLRLTTLNFKCYNCYFKGCYSPKTVCCCGTTLQRKGLKRFLMSLISLSWAIFPSIWFVAGFGILLPVNFFVGFFDCF